MTATHANGIIAGVTTSKPLVQRAAAGTLALAVCLTTGAVLAAPATAASGFAFDQRIGGANRVETAVIASQRAYPDAAASGHAVVLANKDRTVDGLTASYVAGLHDAPILYTDVDTTPSATTAEMSRLGVREVYVVGGTGVVSDAQAESLRSGGVTVTRYGGTDRYETAALAAVSGTGTPGRVFVASGERPADALVVGPLAYAKHYPVLLTRAGDVPTRTSEALERLGVANRTVVGGEGVVAPATYDALHATLRLAGADRQGTATKVAEDAIAHEGASSHDLALVGGLDRNAVDALVAASVAGPRGVPLLFVQGNGTGAATGDYLRAHAPELTGKGYVFGGTGAVSKDAVDAANAAAGNAAAQAEASATRPTLRVGPTGIVAQSLGSSREYTVTGLDDAASYEVALFPADDAYFYADGTITFRDVDQDNTADDLGATKAVVASVGGTATAAGTRVVRSVRPSGGTITFTISSSVADRVNPVVFKDADGDGQLDLVTPATKNGFGKGPVEAFGVGGETDWS